MVGVVTSIGGERTQFDVSVRGYQVLFRPNEANHCPGCGRAQWLVGRLLAECAFCGTALPLAEAHWGESGSSPKRAVNARAIIESDDWSERRRDERLPIEGDRFVRLLVDGSPQAFAIHDLSSGGAKVGSPAELVIAKTVEVIAKGGEIVPVTVRWIGNDMTGLQFAKPVELDLSKPDPAD
jgi:hypothetical protein